MAETWTPIDDPTAFQDDAVFEIDKTTKSIQVLVEQPIVAGENKSQFVKFQMGRYYDAIDLTQMEINILFESPTGYQDINSAVNREYSDEYIRFGWLVPYAACPVKGTLSFAVEFVGADYTLKTTRSTTEVKDSIAGSSAVPEPVEQTWYIELQSQVAAAIDNANSTLETVKELVETFQGDIGEAISDWLTNHPEATTTVQDGVVTTAKLAGGSVTEAKLASDSVSSDKVQDGAITSKKLVTGTLGYVMPQMYGAKADGTTDDLTAFQNAFASGKKVLIPNGSYYLTDYIFVDESQLIDDKGTYSNKKIVTSKTITSASMSVADRKSITLSALGTRWGSGVAYNSDTGKLICCGYEDDKIAQVDFATLTVDRTATITGLRHGNDATYNPNTGKYYCVPMVNNGEIMEINSDLTLNTTIIIDGMDFAPSQISYDRNSDIYYVGNSQYTYVVDANFEIVKLLSAHTNDEIFYNSYENINYQVSQGSAVYNGQFLGGVWLGATGLGLLRGRSYARLVTYDYNSGDIKDCYDFPLHVNGEEFEAVEVVDGMLCLFSCRFGTLFITKVYPDKVLLAHDTTKFPYYIDPTYETNNYCTATDVKRIRTFIHGNIGYIRCNLLLSTTMPVNTREILIGTLGVHIYDETSVILASQLNLGNLLLNIKTDGKMYISNVSTTVTCQGFYRANIPVMFT